MATKFCGVCEEETLLDETWDTHNVSARHLKRQHQRECSMEVEVTGGWAAITQTHLLHTFQRFGPVVGIKMSVREYPRAGLAVLEFAKADSLKKVLRETYYRVHKSLVKVTRWLSTKQRAANEELEERERSLFAEKDRRFQEDLYNTVQLAATTDQQITQLAWMLEMNASELKMAQELRDDIELIIQNYVPEAKVYLIGMVGDGLGIRGCKLHFQVSFDPRAKRPVSQFLAQAPPLPENFIAQAGIGVTDGRVIYTSLHSGHSYEIIWFLYEILSKSNLTLKLSRLELANADSMITFRYLKMQTQCALTVIMSESIKPYSCELTTLLVKLDERVKAIYLAVRFWADRVGLLSYLQGILLPMVYHYLETTKPAVLPSVESLAKLATEGSNVQMKVKSDNQKKMCVRNFDVSFCSDLNRIKSEILTTTNNQSLAELLQGFFKYYTRFDLTNRVFCPHSAKAFNMLKFRNMKKVVPNLARFRIRSTHLHFQDLFRLDTNVGDVRTLFWKHVVCAELARAEVLTRGSLSMWNLLSLIPSDCIDHTRDQPTERHHYKIPFVATYLPEGFLDYQSYAEGESQWYQWIVEIVMRCLKLLRIKYQLEGDYGTLEQTNANKRQMIEEAAARKRRGNWSTLLDEDRAKDFTTTYQPTFDVIQECKLKCHDAYNFWHKRPPPSTRRHHKRALYDIEETVTEMQLSTHKNPNFMAFDFHLTVSHVKSVNETQIDVFTSSDTTETLHLLFFSFFRAFLQKKLCAELDVEKDFFYKKN